jgi:hypothetical protein
MERGISVFALPMRLIQQSLSSVGHMLPQRSSLLSLLKLAILVMAIMRDRLIYGGRPLAGNRPQVPGLIRFSASGPAKEALVLVQQRRELVRALRSAASGAILGADAVFQTRIAPGNGPSTPEAIMEQARLGHDRRRDGRSTGYVFAGPLGHQTLT